MKLPCLLIFKSTFDTNWFLHMHAFSRYGKMIYLLDKFWILEWLFFGGTEERVCHIEFSRYIVFSTDLDIYSICIGTYK